MPAVQVHLNLTLSSVGVDELRMQSFLRKIVISCQYIVRVGTIYCCPRQIYPIYCSMSTIYCLLSNSHTQYTALENTKRPSKISPATVKFVQGHLEWLLEPSSTYVNLTTFCRPILPWREVIAVNIWMNQLNCKETSEN